MDVCTDCGKASLVDEEVEDSLMRACKECGTVTGQAQQLTVERESVGTSISDGKGYAPKGVKSWNNKDPSQPSKGLVLGKTFIFTVGKQMKFDEGMISSAEDLYSRVYDDELQNCRNDERKAMAAACLFSVARSSGFGLALNDVATHLNVNKSVSRIGSCLHKLKANHNVECPSLDIAENVKQKLLKAGFSRKVIEVAQQIISCMEQAMITQGRPDHVLVCPAAYFAWKACNYEAYREETFKSFCTKYKYKMSCATQARKREMQNALKAMVMELPWVKASQQPVKNIDPYIMDALLYKNSLLSKAVEAKVTEQNLQKMTENNETSKIESEKKLAANEATLLDGNASECEPAPHVHSTVFRFPPRKRCMERPSDCEENGFKGSPRKRSRHKSASELSDSEEIVLGSDDDTDIYIITFDEVGQRKKNAETAEV